MKLLRFFYVSIISLLFIGYIFYHSLVMYIRQEYHYIIDEKILQDSLFTPAQIITTTIDEWRQALFETQDNISSNQTQEIQNKQEKQDSIPQSQRDTPQSFTDIPNKKAQESITPTPTLQTCLDCNSNMIESQSTTNPNLNQISNEIPPSSNASIATSPQIMQDFKDKGVKIQNNHLIVSPHANFLLIGDSLMQGIGMTLARTLSKQGFKVKNIAKQSTGLTYQSFFNWSKATKQAFKENPNISVLVVCLGANDPWDMPKKRFGKDEWNEVYNARIREIIDIAMQNHAVVVWYEVPALKNQTLNTKVAFLNTLYKKNIEENGGLFISADDILVNRNFTPYLKNEQGKSTLVRTSDGIHFTLYGSSILTQSFMDRLIIFNPHEENHTMPESKLEQSTSQESINHVNTELQDKQNKLNFNEENPSNTLSLHNFLHIRSFAFLKSLNHQGFRTFQFYT